MANKAIGMFINTQKFEDFIFQIPNTLPELPALSLSFSRSLRAWERLQKVEKGKSLEPSRRRRWQVLHWINGANGISIACEIELQ